jgi:histidyl-tRNA synthetase
MGSVGGGGRYDDLVSRFKGQPIPATGFSIGVSRLVAALAQTGQPNLVGPVVVLVMDQAHLADSLKMAQDLRAAGLMAEPYVGAAGMKAQLKYADKRASPIAVIQGADERDRGTVTLKDLRLGARLAAEAGTDRDAYAANRGQVQQEVPRAALVEAVKAMLEGRG